MKTTAEVIGTKIKTYQTGKPCELPYFIEKKQYQGASGKVYPLKVTDQISSEAEDKTYQMVRLSNDFIEVNLLPEIGGKIYGAKCRKNGYEFIYQNTVVKPALIGLCGPWVSGGVEFNWPQHHRPTTFSPVEYEVKNNADGSSSCYMGEAEPFNRMRAMVAISVYPGSSIVEAKATVTNNADHALPFMWWNNTAVRVHEDYKCIFPPDVSYGVDHDRRAVIPFPVMKGRFETARPYDYGEGVDASWYKNVKVQTSVMIPRYESSMDFVGGYDYRRNAGTAVIGDHYVSPGKKMFTWANCAFGKKWCKNLTDNDDRYIELMTGAYTDNQPDFSYIEPGESKVFTQYWFPIQGIKNISNANVHGAVTLDVKDDNIEIGAVATAYESDVTRPVTLKLTCKGKEIYKKTDVLYPDAYWLETTESVAGASKEDYEVSLQGEDGSVLLSYRPEDHSKDEAPKIRPVAPRPKDIETVEELYLHGAHLLQYKHGTFDPEDYFTEALRRLPDDYRCNLEMGKLSLEKGDFTAANRYLLRAYARITMRNYNPRDTEVLYTLGRLKRLTGDMDKAYGYFKSAAWQYAYRSASEFACACISMSRRNVEKAVEELRACLETNVNHYAAYALLCYLTKDREGLEQKLEFFPQESNMRYALYLLGGKLPDAFIRDRAEDVLDVALLFKKAGLVHEAVQILKTCTRPTDVLLFHLYALGEEARTVEPDTAFPRRLEDIAVLENIRADAKPHKRALARYLLGCLYFDRENYQAAEKAFEEALAIEPGYAAAYRNLAFLYYDHLDKKEQAMDKMQLAVNYASNEPRILYEALQLMKQENVDPDTRLHFVRKHEEGIKSRDDAYLESIILYIQTGRYEKAEELLAAKDFHIYEGGEGKLTKYHRWLYILKAKKLCDAGRFREADQAIDQALVYPDNYGEGEAIFKQDANVHYMAGWIRELLGDRSAAKAEYRKAGDESDTVSDILYYSALCSERLGDMRQAKMLYQKLIQAGEERLGDEDRYGYFGVGMINPLPFESDIMKTNQIAGYTYLMLGYYGLRDINRYTEYKKKLGIVDPYNASLTFFTKMNENMQENKISN